MLVNELGEPVDVIEVRRLQEQPQRGRFVVRPAKPVQAHGPKLVQGFGVPSSGSHFEALAGLNEVLRHPIPFQVAVRPSGTPHPNDHPGRPC